MTNKQSILILCTGNSARSQMAEGLLRHDYGDFFDVVSAGTQPSIVRPEAIAVMDSIGIDISSHRSKNVLEFQHKQFDHVITVCDNARENCPVFFGTVNRVHHSFDDPATVVGTETQRLAEFARVRDEMRDYLTQFAESVKQR